MNPRPWLRPPLQLMTAGLALWAVPGSAAVAAPASPARHMAMPAAAQLAQVPACDPTASLRPAGPPVVTAGSFMAKIRARGFLIAGVGQTTFYFGYLNPADGKTEGFDIDIVHAIAAAIFGNLDKVEFRSVTSAQRISGIQSGKVVIVAATMTITCARLQQVDFSTVYFDAGQRVLVSYARPASRSGHSRWRAVARYRAVCGHRVLPRGSDEH